MATTSMDSPKPEPDTNTELDANPNLNPNPNSSNSLVPTSSNGPDVCLLKFAGDSAGGAFMGSIFRNGECGTTHASEYHLHNTAHHLEVRDWIEATGFYTVRRWL